MIKPRSLIQFSVFRFHVSEILLLALFCFAVAQVPAATVQSRFKMSEHDNAVDKANAAASTNDLNTLYDLALVDENPELPDITVLNDDIIFSGTLSVTDGITSGQPVNVGQLTAATNAVIQEVVDSAIDPATFLTPSRYDDFSRRVYRPKMAEPTEIYPYPVRPDVQVTPMDNADGRNYVMAHGMAWDRINARWVVVTCHGTSHMSMDNPLWAYYSLDGAAGQEWSEGVEIIPHVTDERAYRDVALFFIGSEMFLVTTACELTSIDRHVEFWRSIDGGTSWDFVSNIDASTSDDGFPEKAATTKPIFFNGEWIQAVFSNSNVPYTHQAGYFRVELYSSTDNLRTWTLKSTPYGTTVAWNPNETTLLTEAGKLIMLTRNEEPDNSTAENSLVYCMSDDGVIWDDYIDFGADMANGAGRPDVIKDAYNRFFFAVRSSVDPSALFGRSSFVNPQTGQKTAPVNLRDDVGRIGVGEESRSLYCSLWPMDDGRIAVSHATEWTADSSFISFSVIDARPMPLEDNTTEMREYDTAVAVKGSQEPLFGDLSIVTDLNVINTNTFAGYKTMRFTGGSARVLYGAPIDVEFLHDGSPWTIGCLFNATEDTQYLYGTSITSSENGMFCRIENDNYFSTGVMKDLAGSSGAPLIPGTLSGTGFTWTHPWNCLIWTFDGTNYRMFINGVENVSGDFPAQPAFEFGTGAASQGLYLGKIPSGAVQADQELFIRSFYVAREAFDADDRETLTTWLHSK